MPTPLERLLEQYADRVATRRVLIARDATARLPALLRELLPATRALLFVADTNTWDAAGPATAGALAAAGYTLGSVIFEGGLGQDKIHPDEAYIERVEQRLRATDAVAVAVGAGTINDIAKMASFRVERPYAVVATAPSMNGWTSAIAAVVVGGLKSTLAARGPVLVAADLGVLRDAPGRMIGAGYADMVAKWVAAADWRLSDVLLATGAQPEVEEISRLAIDLLEGREEAIAQRDPQAITQLMEALCISGLSMAVARSSSHISGAEHLFSHYIDMMIDEVSDRELHGRQVGIGTLCSAALYEQLLEWSPERLDLEARVLSQPAWADRAQAIAAQFGELAPVVLPQAQALHVEGEALRARLERLVAEWPRLREELAAIAGPRAAIEERLRKAQAPIHFADLGLEESQVREILTWARDIRGRYTILHLAAELGCLEAWIEGAIGSFAETPVG